MKKQKRKERKNDIRISTNMFPLFLSNAERKLDETNCPNTSKKENKYSKEECAGERINLEL